ncbi:MAG: SUMF1/EgtB/PvdO family nonheme iron enzyme [Planctomycetota bacterium]|nr:SUMF1/EgtB/PvdO family nonheme iron enzyme [Planctomycetota bacterium]
MTRNGTALLAACLAGCCLLGATATSAEVVMSTEHWPDNDAGFRQFTERITQLQSRNLLGRRGTRIVPDGSVGDAGQLVDGFTGARGAEGRVFINGQPTGIAFYLGQLKTVTEIGLFTFNCDARANQDFEVRLADNSQRPGLKPDFRKEPDLTSGNVILGQNSGGFHTRFVGRNGSPLAPSKVDWVEFRIWRTYNVKAGEPAKSKSRAESGSSYIELEVLGTPDDVTPGEELAHREALRKAPRQPEYVKRATALETLVAGREAILAWEAAIDCLIVPDQGITLGPWHVLGPVTAGDKKAAELEKATQVDLTKRLAAAGGRELIWEPRADLPDGELIDLTGYRGAKEKDVLYLCRQVTFHRKFDNNQLFAPVSASEGWIRWLPKQQTAGLRGPVAANHTRWQLEGEPGEHQLLVRLSAGNDGRWRFWFAVQPTVSRPGAGAPHERVGRRANLFRKVCEDFPAPLDRLQLRWQTTDKFWDSEQNRFHDWLPGESEAYLRANYRAAVQKRLADLKAALAGGTGLRAMVVADKKERLTAAVEAVEAAFMLETSATNPSPPTPLPGLPGRGQYERLCTLQETIAVAARVRSLRLAVEDQRETFPDRYPRGDKFLARVRDLDQHLDALWERVLKPQTADVSQTSAVLQAVVATNELVQTAGQEILLENPVLAFEKLLVVKGGAGFNSNWGGPNTLGNSLVVVSPPRPGGQETILYKGRVSDVDLHWDGQRLLFSDGRALWEINVDGTGLRRVSKEDPPITHYDGCYLPDGRIVCVSNACEQAVPCTGQADVGNLHLLDADGSNERRVSFDQDHNWNPVLLNDGRVLYTRWEYTDTPHYFTRLLFRMNPDGTGQMEYYGSNSYWPNAMYWPRPIPGHPTMVSCIVSGHHGVSRVGEMVLLDPARGRHEADGVVQRLPGYGQKVEPVILDRLVVETWPRYAAPYPLAEPGTNRGAGKYFLVCVQDDERSAWDVCLIDVFDNVTRILTGGYMTPIPLQTRQKPPVIPSRVEPERKDATVYLADVYAGPGLRGYPRGSIQRLRIGTHHYRYPGNGDTYASSHEGGWDIKRILGTVPVAADGSALFRVPANTPIFVQPLDAEGKCQQIMRSWYTPMPGEIASCVGCHEKQNDGPPAKYTAAALQKPSPIEPWCGPTRGFSFDREVQPVLDRRCVGCHNGQPTKVGEQSVTTLDLRAKRLHENYDGPYSPAYKALQAYVRRPGFEADYHLQVPAEFEADTSALVQLLKKGHYHVQLTGEEWERLYTWIDFNVPYPANWRESHRPPRDEQVALRAKYKQQFANLDDHDEDPLPLPEIVKFEAPQPAAPRATSVPSVEGWPIATTAAQALQQAAGEVEKQLDLGEGVTMKFRLVPAGSFVMGDSQGFDDECTPSAVTIARPFYLDTCEVTNQQFSRFDAAHDSAYIDGRGKDRTSRGTPINRPAQPVVRITWHQALAYCRWLTERTGARATLPTEAQWEWACRAGTATRWSFGEFTPSLQRVANIADGSLAGWNFGRQEAGYQDGAQFSVPSGSFPTNAWGLSDLHGNVAEWCLSTYRPYPYRTDDGRDDPNATGPKVVRGGSWNDTMRFATSASRWRYEPYKPVYNVGFRVLLEIPGSERVAAAQR